MNIQDNGGDHHPSLAGSYLSALTHYSALFNSSAVGSRSSNGDSMKHDIKHHLVKFPDLWEARLDIIQHAFLFKYLDEVSVVSISLQLHWGLEPGNC